jgi:acetyl-CoA C-acetyltransferase
MPELNEAVIISAARTPVGKFLGSLKGFKATELGAIVVRESVKRAGIKPEEVDEVIMGCVIQAGLGQNPARQAALRGGLSPTVAAVTVNKVCGSGLKAVMMAAQAVKLGDSGDGRRGRHGVDEQCALSDPEGARRLSSRQWRTGRLDDQRRAVVRV